MRIDGVVARPGTATERTETILVVDEDRKARALMSDLLRGAGFKTHEASTGAEALHKAGEAPPTAVLVNVALPGMTGYEVCHYLRERFGEELPIIFVSGTRTEPLDRVAGLLIGADDYVVEPFAAEELVARVRRSVKRAKAARLMNPPAFKDRSGCLGTP